MSDSDELTVPVQNNDFPETPQGQHFKTQELGVEGTPWDVGEDAGNLVLNKIRDKIARLMNNETLLCPIDKFLAHYGPAQVATADVTKCKEFLVSEKQFNKKIGRWTGFEFNPVEYEDVEDKVFEDLQLIVEKIFEFADKKQGNKYKFKVAGRANLSADIAGTNHRMDGCLVDGKHYETGQIPVRFIISPHEYKKKHEAEEQRIVRSQIVADCQHILCEDPRRMFIFAVTIEDTLMSVWYFSRSHSMKALAFDWVEGDVDTFIRVFLAFAYATPEQLGVDSTVHLAPIPVGAKAGTEAAAQHYIYQCPIEPGPQDETGTVRRSTRLAGPHYKYFKTVQSINHMRPYNISGRSTRIWKVVEVKGPDTNETVTGESLILKDVWLDTTRATEADNMDSIFKAIDKFVETSKKKYKDNNNWQDLMVTEDPRFASFDEPTKARLQHFLTDGNYKSLFLTKLHAWKGAKSKSLCKGALNSAPGVDIFPDVAAVEKPGYQCRTGLGSLIYSGVTSQANTSVDASNPPAAEDKNPAEVRKSRRKFEQKQQSRFIYKEECFALDRVGTLGNFMDLMSQALDALRILFVAGWVHRDISSTNLLAFDDNGKWKIKLADLEFSQELGYNAKRSDPRTGTPFFMPFEIMQRRHLLDFVRHEEDPDASMAMELGLSEGSPEYECYKVFSKFGIRTRSVPSTASIANIPPHKSIVRYNFQHDLESIWWIMLYFITALVNHPDSKQFAPNVFKAQLKASGERVTAFRQNLKGEIGDCLHPSLQARFLNLMEKLRVYLHEEYLARELFGQLTVPASYSTIHGLFATQVRKFLEVNEGDWKQMPIAPNGVFTNTQFAGSKRGFEHDEAAAPVALVDKKRTKIARK